MKFLYKIIAILFLTFLIASCKGEGIFYTLRDEIKIANASFPDDADIRDIFLVNSIPVAVGKTLWVKSFGSWFKISFPGNLNINEDALTSAVEFQGDVYATFRTNGTNGTSSIWSYDLGGTNLWQPRSFGLAVDDSDVFYLFSEPGQNELFINRIPFGEPVSPSSDFYNSSSADLSDMTSITLAGLGSMPVLDMAYDSVNNQYWLVANEIPGTDGILFTDNGTPTTFTSESTGDYGSVYVVSISGIDSILIAGRFNSLLNYQVTSTFNNGTWNSISLPNGYGISYIDLDPNAADDAGLPDKILVGIFDSVSTYDQGYITLNYNRSTGALSYSSNIASDSNYNSSRDLHSSVINGFIQTGTSPYYGILAATTSGIWSYSYSNNIEYAVWSQE